jgi:hypothetical protein
LGTWFILTWMCGSLSFGHLDNPCQPLRILSSPTHAGKDVVVK